MPCTLRYENLYVSWYCVIQVPNVFLRNGLPDGFNLTPNFSLTVSPNREILDMLVWRPIGVMLRSRKKQIILCTEKGLCCLRCMCKDIILVNTVSEMHRRRGKTSTSTIFFMWRSLFRLLPMCIMWDRKFYPEAPLILMLVISAVWYRIIFCKKRHSLQKHLTHSLPSLYNR